MSLVTGSAFGFTGPDWIGSNIMKDRNREDAEIAFNRTAEFQERMSNTSWQRGVQDMQAAGINPMLAFQQGGASSPQPTMALPHSSLVSGGANASKQYQTSPQVKLLEATTDKTAAEAAEVRARTPTHGTAIDKMQQDIRESIERIQDLRASVQERTASAGRQYQQTENLRAELPRIKADTTRILEQAKLFIADTRLTTAQEKEAQQRIRADLPDLEKIHRDLIIAIQRIEQPGKELDADARQSFLGILGHYLHRLIPLGGIVGAIPLGRMGNTGPSTSGTIIHKGKSGGPDIHRR